MKASRSGQNWKRDRVAQREPGPALRLARAGRRPGRVLPSGSTRSGCSARTATSAPPWSRSRPPPRCGRQHVLPLLPHQGNLVLQDDMDTRVIEAFERQPTGLQPGRGGARRDPARTFSSYTESELETVRETTTLTMTVPEVRGPGHGRVLPHHRGHPPTPWPSGPGARPTTWPIRPWPARSSASSCRSPCPGKAGPATGRASRTCSGPHRPGPRPARGRAAALGRSPSLAPLRAGRPGPRGWIFVAGPRQRRCRAARPQSMQPRRSSTQVHRLLRVPGRGTDPGARVSPYALAPGQRQIRGPRWPGAPRTGPVARAGGPGGAGASRPGRSRSWRAAYHPPRARGTHAPRSTLPQRHGPVSSRSAR